MKKNVFLSKFKKEIFLWKINTTKYLILRYKYIDIFSSKKTAKKTTKNETTTDTKPIKSKKQFQLPEVTKETISKMTVPNMRLVLKTRYNDTEVDSINAKSKEDREKLRNRLLEKFKAETTSSEDENSEVSIQDVLESEPNTLNTEQDDDHRNQALSNQAREVTKPEE